MIKKHCEYCQLHFEDISAYQIHLGIGAPAFHRCNNPEEMKAKGMTTNQQGEWSIDKKLYIIYQGWASLRSSWKQESLPLEDTL